MIKHTIVAENLQSIFILPFFSLTHKIMDVADAGYLLTRDDEYSAHHDHIRAVLQCVE